MVKFFLYIGKLLIIVFLINSIFSEIHRISGIVFSIVLILVYSYMELKSYLEKSGLPLNTQFNKIFIDITESLDYSLKKFGISLIYALFITAFISTLGSKIFPVKKIGHFLEPKEYEVKYLIKYKFDSSSLNSRIATANILRESYDGKSFYSISHINDNDINYDFQEGCVVGSLNEWFVCDEITLNNQNIWILITESRVD